LLIFLKPSNIFGSSDGLTGSTAIFSTEFVLNLNGRNMCAYNTQYQRGFVSSVLVTM